MLTIIVILPALGAVASATILPDLPDPPIGVFRTIAVSA